MPKTESALARAEEYIKGEIRRLLLEGIATGRSVEQVATQIEGAFGRPPLAAAVRTIALHKAISATVLPVRPARTPQGRGGR